MSNASLDPSGIGSGKSGNEDKGKGSKTKGGKGKGKFGKTGSAAETAGSGGAVGEQARKDAEEACKLQNRQSFESIMKSVRSKNGIQQCWM